MAMLAGQRLLARRTSLHRARRGCGVCRPVPEGSSVLSRLGVLTVAIATLPAPSLSSRGIYTADGQRGRHHTGLPHVPCQMPSSHAPHLGPSHDCSVAPGPPAVGVGGVQLVLSPYLTTGRSAGRTCRQQSLSWTQLWLRGHLHSEPAAGRSVSPDSIAN